MVLETISDNMAQKRLFYVVFCQTPLRNSVAMATPKILGDQKLFERVCYMLKLKFTKFQLPRPTVSELYLKKKQLGGGQICHLPVQTRVKLVDWVNH